MSGASFQFGIITLGFVSALILVLALLWIRHRTQRMRHEERLLAIEKGNLPAAQALAPWSPRVYLLRGLIWTLGGAALTIALVGAAMTARTQHHVSAELRATWARQVSEKLQIPIDQARQIVDKDDAERAANDSAVPLAFAAFGIVPMAVGVAYLVFYYNDPSRNYNPPQPTAYTPPQGRA